MNKKMILILAILQIILIGSLIAIVSGNNEEDITDEITDDICTGNCSYCNGACDDRAFCNTQANQNCDGTGTCIQNNKQNTNCNTICDGSGTCRQNTQQGRNCFSKSSCSGTCTT